MTASQPFQSFFYLNQTQNLSLNVHNIRDQLQQARLRRVPSKQLPRTDSVAPGVGAPDVQAKVQYLGNLVVAQRLDLRRRDQLLLIGRLGHGPLDVAPDEGSVLGEVVALAAPGGVSAACGRGLAQSKVDVAEILHVDLVPDVLALADQEALLPLEDGRREEVGLDASGVDGSTARAVDRGRADDGRLHAVRGALAGGEDDLVHRAV